MDLVGDKEVAFSLEIMPSALAELKAVKVLYRRAIADATEEQLRHQPLVETKNRKLLPGVQPLFECEPPIWELRVGDFRVFCEVDKEAQVVYVRAVREKRPHAETEEIL
jgi:mRNA-degrading endonuclease RelE of RelBE toxin-antitoxin system